MTHPTVPALRWGRFWSQSVDQPQGFLEHVVGRQADRVREAFGLQELVDLRIRKGRISK